MTSAIVLSATNIPEVEDDTKMKLSPDAPEFYPSSVLDFPLKNTCIFNDGVPSLVLVSEPRCPSDDQDPQVNLCIFNDGVPSLVPVSEADISDLLHGIPDDAIDETFVPTAEEAAEIEAAMDFVDTMATLAYMEEQEEMARFNFGHIKKRWESRRAEGLNGRPRPAKHLVKPVHHGMPATSQAIVCYQGHCMLMSHPKLLQKEADFRAKHQGMNRRHFAKQRNTVIQQPRKLN